MNTCNSKDCSKRNQPKAGQAKMEKIEKLLGVMEKFLVKVEKIILYSWQDLSCYLKTVTHVLLSGHKERALCCLFSSKM